MLNNGALELCKTPHLQKTICRIRTICPSTSYTKILVPKTMICSSRVKLAESQRNEPFANVSSSMTPKTSYLDKI